MTAKGTRSLTYNAGNWLCLLLSTMVAYGVSARNLHGVSSQTTIPGCTCGHCINIFGVILNICKNYTGHIGDGVGLRPPIPSSPPLTPSPSPLLPPTLYLVRVNNKCNEDIIVALMENQTLMNSFVRIPIGTGGGIGQSYLPIVLYGYGVSSRNAWQGETCFQADSKYSKDPILLKNEPSKRTVCGVTIPKFDRVEYLPEAAYYQGEVDFRCEEKKAESQPLFQFAWHLGQKGR